MQYIPRLLYAEGTAWQLPPGWQKERPYIHRQVSSWLEWQPSYASSVEEIQALSGPHCGVAESDMKVSIQWRDIYECDRDSPYSKFLPVVAG